MILQTLATAYSIGGGEKEVLSLTSKTLGAEAKITKLAAPIIGPAFSSFFDNYKIERGCGWWSVNRFPKTWVNVVNGIGSFTDLVLTTIGTIDLFGGKNEIKKFVQQHIELIVICFSAILGVLEVVVARYPASMMILMVVFFDCAGHVRI